MQNASRPRRAIVFVAHLALASSIASLAPADAFAQQPQPAATLARAEVALGRARVRTTIVVRPAADGRAEIELSSGASRVVSAIEPRAVTVRWAIVHDVEVARGVHAAVVFASSEAPAGGGRAVPERGWVAVVGLGSSGAPEVVFRGPLAIEGDIGERSAVGVALDDRTGDGFADVVVGHRVEGARLCGATRLPLLDPSALDPTTLRLRRVELSPLLGAPGGEEGITAREDSPGPSGDPMARVVTWESASSSARSATASFRRAPLELGDGRRDTHWAFARARFDHATARITPGAGAIRAFALTLTPADATLARRHRRLRTLWLAGDSGPRLRVTIPGDALLRPDGRYWVVPPRPLVWRCFSLVVGETYGDASAHQAAIADVAVYTELDFGEGLARLAARLEEAGHSAAAETLGRSGMRGAEAIFARWPRMGEQGRLRALDVLDRIAETARGSSDETAVRDRVSAFFVEAFDDASPLVAARTYATLGALDAPAAALLTASLSGTDEARALRALDVLAGSQAEGAPPLLLAALADTREPVRIAAAHAVGRFALRVMSPRRGGPGLATPAAIESIVQSLGSDPRISTDAAARVLVELSRVSVLSEPVAAGVSAHWPRATTFPDRYRLVRAAARTSSAAGSRDVLVAGAERGEPWPLRALAVTALGGMADAETHAALLQQRLTDPVVRVRVATVLALAPHRWAEDAIARAAETDRWPLVRAAGLEALARPDASPAARRVIVRAVDDEAWSVRASAIRALGPSRIADANRRVLERLADAHEPAEVRRAAIELIERRCWTAARSTLLALLRERPESLSDDWVSLGVAAWRALHRLGPSSELRAAEGFGRGLPARLQREVRRVRRCAR